MMIEKERKREEETFILMRKDLKLSYDSSIKRN
jgi:hypothetical protein